MPTIMSHAIVPIALGLALGKDRIPPATLWAGAILAMVPDLDVIGFRLGIPYESPLGHRGASHALLMAGALASLCLLVLKDARTIGQWLFLFLAAASHGILDAFTSGGLGPALFWPFENDRHFAPWQPIRVSPIGAGFFSMRGVETLISEARWIWLPMALLAISIRTITRRRSA